MRRLCFSSYEPEVTLEEGDEIDGLRGGSEQIPLRGSPMDFSSKWVMKLLQVMM
jgi:hypothetical protein